MSLADMDANEISLKTTLELAKLARDLHRDHRDMFALTAFEQSRDDIDNARIDIEYDRLEASQPPAATEESGSNFMEALNTNAADFFPNAADMIPPAGGGEPDDGASEGATEE